MLPRCLTSVGLDQLSGICLWSCFESVWLSAWCNVAMMALQACYVICATGQMVHLNRSCSHAMFGKQEVHKTRTPPPPTQRHPMTAVADIAHQSIT